MSIIDWVKRNILGITYNDSQDAPNYLGGAKPVPPLDFRTPAEKFQEKAEKILEQQERERTFEAERHAAEVVEKPKRKKKEVKEYLPDITKMTKKELREFAEGKGIEVDGRNKKATILADIQKALKE